MVSEPDGIRAQTVNLWFVGSNPIIHPKGTVTVPVTLNQQLKRMSD